MAEVVNWQHGALKADYAVVWSPPQQLLDEQPQLKALFNIGAGVDALMALRLPDHLQVVRLDNTSSMSVQMAEFVCHAVIRHFRELDSYEGDMRECKWSFRRTRRREEWPVGVMGMGMLGTRVAQSLRTFDFPINGWSRSTKAIDGVRCFAGREQLDDFLSATRILVCMLPLTPDTQDILNRDTLGRLLPGGYLVNVARGGHLVEGDLLALLEQGQLAGATLDVMRKEPLPSDHPFWCHPKITLTPHISARNPLDESIAQIASKIQAMERGEPVSGVVDLTRGY